MLWLKIAKLPSRLFSTLRIKLQLYLFASPGFLNRHPMTRPRRGILPLRHPLYHSIFIEILTHIETKLGTTVANMYLNGFPGL